MCYQQSAFSYLESLPAATLCAKTTAFRICLEGCKYPNVHIEGTAKISAVCLNVDNIETESKKYVTRKSHFMQPYNINV